jgi:hypothetical protein
MPVPLQRSIAQFITEENIFFCREKRRELAATQATNYQHSTKQNAATIEALSKVKKGANLAIDSFLQAQ